MAGHNKQQEKEFLRAIEQAANERGLKYELDTKGAGNHKIRVGPNMHRLTATHHFTSGNTQKIFSHLFGIRDTWPKSLEQWFVATYGLRGKKAKREEELAIAATAVVVTVKPVKLSKKDIRRAKKEAARKAMEELERKQKSGKFKKVVTGAGVITDLSSPPPIAVREISPPIPIPPESKTGAPELPVLPEEKPVAVPSAVSRPIQIPAVVAGAVTGPVGKPVVAPSAATAASPVPVRPTVQAPVRAFTPMEKSPAVAEDAAKKAAEKEAVLKMTSTPVLKRVFESGFASVQELVDVMNANPYVRAKKDIYEVTHRRVDDALNNPEAAFGADRVNLDILYFRILQTVNTRRAEKRIPNEFKEEEFYGVKKADPQGDTPEEILMRVRRYVHDNLLGILESSDNRHIQSMTHLLSACRDDAKAVSEFLENPYSAYIRNGDNITPSRGLQALAGTLSVGIGSLLKHDRWARAMLVVNPHDHELADLMDHGFVRKTSPPAKPPRLTVVKRDLPVPRSIVVSPAQRTETYRGPSVTAVQAAEPETVPVETMDVEPQTIAPAAIVPKPEVVPAIAASSDIRGTYRTAAIEILSTYRQMKRASMTFLRRTEGINLAGKTETLAEAREGFDMDEADAELILNRAKQQLLDAAAKAGLKPAIGGVLAALRVFESDEDHVVLTASLDGKNDKEIGKRFSPAISETAVRDARENLLDRMMKPLGYSPA